MTQPPVQPYEQPAGQPYQQPAPPVPPAPPAGQPYQQPVAPSGGPVGGLPASLSAVRDPLDWVLLAAGPLTLIFSLMPYYTAKASYMGFSRSAHENAWHGFFGWFGAIVALAASVIIALELFAPGQVKLPVPAPLAVLGLFGLAFVCYLLAWFITPGVGDIPSEIKVDFGRGIGFYLGLIFILAGGVVAFLRFQRAGKTA